MKNHVSDQVSNGNWIVAFTRGFWLGFGKSLVAAKLEQVEDGAPVAEDLREVTQLKTPDRGVQCSH